jgi:hypothetical protein
VWSLPAAAVGIAVTAVLVRRLAASRGDREVEAYWALGLAALTPAWVIEFLGILRAGVDPGRTVRMFFMASVGVAMAGVLLSNTLARRLDARGPGRRPYACWLLGIGALVPPWLLAFVGRALLRP